jgi:hypothetical protein
MQPNLPTIGEIEFVLNLVGVDRQVAAIAFVGRRRRVGRRCFVRRGRLSRSAQYTRYTRL